MIRPLFFVGAMLASVSVLAQQQIADLKPNVKDVDANRYCIYGNQVYTVGSEIKAPDRVLKCVYEGSSYHSGNIAGAQWKDPEER